MIEAFAWGAFAASSLLVGALLALVRPVGERTLGLVMAFGAGVLISAVAYELVGEAASIGNAYWPIAVGVGVGALTYYAGDRYIERLGGEGAGLPLVLGIVLDGIPESIVLGLTLLSGDGISAAMVAAVFLSNLPEGMAATRALVDTGHRRGRVLLLWGSMVLVGGLAALAGFALFDGVRDTTVALVLAFAAGAVLTMLADTMMPQAYEHGGRSVGLATSLGFTLALAIVALEYQ